MNEEIREGPRNINQVFITRDIMYRPWSADTGGLICIGGSADGPQEILVAIDCAWSAVLDHYEARLGSHRLVWCK